MKASFLAQEKRKLKKGLLLYRILMESNTTSRFGPRAIVCSVQSNFFHQDTDRGIIMTKKKGGQNKPHDDVIADRKAAHLEKTKKI